VKTHTHEKKNKKKTSVFSIACLSIYIKDKNAHAIINNQDRTSRDCGSIASLNPRRRQSYEHVLCTCEFKIAWRFQYVITLL